MAATLAQSKFKRGDKVRYRPWLSDGYVTSRGEWIYGVVRSFDHYGNVWVVAWSGAAEYVDPSDVELLQ